MKIIEFCVDESSGSIPLEELGIPEEEWDALDTQQQSMIVGRAIFGAIPLMFRKIDSDELEKENEQIIPPPSSDEIHILDLAIDWGMSDKKIEEQVIAAMAGFGTELLDKVDGIAVTGIKGEAVFDVSDDISDIEIIVRRRFPLDKKSRTVH